MISSFDLNVDITTPASQAMKFQGISPKNIENIKCYEGMLRCGKLRFIAQLGEPGNTLADNIKKKRSDLCSFI